MWSLFNFIFCSLIHNPYFRKVFDLSVNLTWSSLTATLAIRVLYLQYSVRQLKEHSLYSAALLWQSFSEHYHTKGKIKEFLLCYKLKHIPKYF